MALTGNPIELLMTLGVDSNKSRSNVDSQVQALKKYYDRNPLLISLGVNKGNLERELNNLKSIISKEKANLDVNITTSGASNGMKELESQINKVIGKLSELDRKMKSVGSGSYGSSNLGNMSTASIANSITQLQALNTNTRQSAAHFNNLQSAVNNTSQSLNGISNNASQASRSTNDLGNAFGQAFQKFPVWMITAGLFYAPIRGLEDMTKRVIELDSALIGLARVMDAPEYQFNEMIEKSLVNVRELSGVTTEYLELLNEFARMGYNSSDSLDMSNTAQIFTNISDLNAKESVNTLVSGMLAFNIAAEDSVKIADALNEVKCQPPFAVM